MEAARTRYFCDAFRFAIESRDLSMVQELLQHDFSSQAIVPATNNWHQSPILEAVSTSQNQIVALLLKHLGSVSSEKLLGKCLMCAVGLRSKPMVELLIAYGADINCAFDYASPLARACILGDIEIANFIHEKGGQMFGKDVLPSLASRGYDKIVERLLNWGQFSAADVSTAMIEACSKGYVKVLEQLLSSSIKPEFDHMRKILDLALEKGYMLIAKLLISNVAEFRESFHTTSSCGIITSQHMPNGNDLHSSLDVDLLFHLSVIIGNCDMIRKLASEGADPNSLKSGKTPLYAVILSQMFTAVPVLLDVGANVNSKNVKNRTALHAAARLGLSEDIVILLLDSGAEIMAKDDNGRIALMDACELGTCKQEVSRVLIDRCPVHAMEEVDNTGATALHIAAARGRSIVATQLILKGAKVTTTDLDRNTPLHLACRSGSSEIVAPILKQMSINEINSRNRDGKTALHFACVGGYTAIISKLLSSGARTDIVDNKCFTPLHVAVSREEAVLLLLNHGTVNVNAVDSEGNTALHKACSLNPEKPVVVRQLLKAGSDVNALNVTKMSPLMLCCSGAIESVKDIIDAGADVNYLNSLTGDTPLLVLCRSTPKFIGSTSRSNQKKQFSAINEVLNHGAVESQTTSDGMNALDLACHCACNIDLLRFLLHKVSPTLRNCWLLNGSVSKLLLRMLKNPVRYRRFSVTTTVELVKVLVEYGAPIELNEKYILDLYEWNLYVMNLMICLASESVPTLLLKLCVMKRDLLTIQRMHECGFDIFQKVFNIIRFCPIPNAEIKPFMDLLKSYLSEPRSLKSLARLRIRTHLKLQRDPRTIHGIANLPLPKQLQEFLAFMTLPKLSWQ